MSTKIVVLLLLSCISFLIFTSDTVAQCKTYGDGRIYTYSSGFVGKIDGKIKKCVCDQNVQAPNICYSARWVEVVNPTASDKSSPEIEGKIKPGYDDNSPLNSNREARNDNPSSNKGGRIYNVEAITHRWKGKYGIMFQVDFDVSDYKDRQLALRAYIRDRNGNALQDSNGKMDAEGLVATGELLTPQFTHSSFKSFRLFIPFNELEMNLNLGTVTLKYFVTLQTWETPYKTITSAQIADITVPISLGMN